MITMPDGPINDVLGRKAQAAQKAIEARGMSPTKALRRAFSRTADVLWDLALVTQGVTIESHDQDGVIDGLAQNDLLILLDGPDGAIGLASVDRDILTGVTEVQTILQVTQMPADRDRTLTPTDAAMMAPLLDGTIDRMVAALEDHPLAAQVEGYKFGAMVEDARGASLLLDAAGYRIFRAEMDLALGRRKGAVSIILPERVVAAPETPDREEDDPFGPHAPAMNQIPVRLDGVLSRIRMTLSEAEALKPGDLLALPVDVMDQLELVDGRHEVVARGRLGQLHNSRAIRLTWPEGQAPATPVAAPAGDVLDGFAADLHEEPALDSLPEPAASEHIMDVDDLPDLPDLPMSTEDQMGDLPDLGDLDFSTDAAAFDLDLADEKFDAAQSGGDDLMDLGDLDFGAESFDIENL